MATDKRAVYNYEHTDVEINPDSLIKALYKACQPGYEVVLAAVYLALTELSG